MSRMGSKISSLRMLKGLTVKQLAKMIGVSESFVAEVESGKKVISDELIKRVSKALGEDISELSMLIPEKTPEKEERAAAKSAVKSSRPEVQKVWNDAFESVLKAVPVYDYGLDRTICVKQLPVVSNKVEGYAKDKVIYIEIQDNDMIGFRIVKGDLALGYITGEIENNAVCLVECEGERFVRQLKRLEGDRIMLLHNNGRLVTETAASRAVKVLARLVRLEVKL